MGKRAAASVIGKFEDEAARAFQVLVDEFGLAGPSRNPRLAGPSIIYSGETIRYLVVLDPRELVVSTQVRALAARPPAHASLGDLVVAAGVGPRQVVRSNAHTVHNLLATLAAQAEIVAELHPRLSGPEGVALLRAAMS